MTETQSGFPISIGKSENDGVENTRPSHESITNETNTVRMHTYYNVIHKNAKRAFMNKQVMDVGAGSGILSFWSILHGGCKLVHIVEASTRMCIECITPFLHTNINISNNSGINGGDDGKKQRKYLDYAHVINKTVEQLVDQHESSGGDGSASASASVGVIENGISVDTIISEPIGVLLVHERMLESFLLARDQFLKTPENPSPSNHNEMTNDTFNNSAEGGNIFPSGGNITMVPLSDPYLYYDVVNNKLGFWKYQQQHFSSTNNFASSGGTQTDMHDVDVMHGIDFSACDLLCKNAEREYFESVYVGPINTDSILSTRNGNGNGNYGGDGVEMMFNFYTDSVSKLHAFDLPFRWEVRDTAIINCVGGWFDVYFFPRTHEYATHTSANHSSDSNVEPEKSTVDLDKYRIRVADEEMEGDVQGEKGHGLVKLDTSPYNAPTHWHQVRLLLKSPIAVNRNEVLSGYFSFRVNKHRSYDISMYLACTPSSLSDNANSNANANTDANTNIDVDVDVDDDKCKPNHKYIQTWYLQEQIYDYSHYNTNTNTNMNTGNTGASSGDKSSNNSNSNRNRNRNRLNFNIY
ncbi:Histone-arginine methyltransferase CARM1 [Zancudomyces culisetae]|uniref:type I protein arginine methyltransferase n=1 Tax=Zancudomyces culisetae TaxID=1213189 RepID=A0A1R1PEK2_ZANCU|nr:Histone-arginine methyltransferase CARM1 [Zancudomyces culisetae]|eukprot:OMH79302.1 Histone-arginine methyltransferase CARM1 [Zancudomyces culisetae]